MPNANWSTLPFDKESCCLCKLLKTANLNSQLIEFHFAVASGETRFTCTIPTFHKEYFFQHHQASHHHNNTKRSSLSQVVHSNCCVKNKGRHLLLDMQHFTGRCHFLCQWNWVKILLTLGLIPPLCFKMEQSNIASVTKTFDIDAFGFDAADKTRKAG